MPDGRSGKDFRLRMLLAILISAWQLEIDFVGCQDMPICDLGRCAIGLA